MDYSTLEYNKQFGCYIKWIHGDRDQKINKLYCMSAFHFYTRDTGYIINEKYKKYAEYLYVSVISIIENKDAHVRIYLDDSVIAPTNAEAPVWQMVIDKLRAPYVQIVFIKMPRYYNDAANCHQGLLPTIFRFLPIFDANVGICIFRDIDNIWTEQDDYFIGKWLETGTAAEDIFLFMNENYKRSEVVGLTRTDILLAPKQYTTILAGIWAIKKKQPVYSAQLWHRMFAYVETYTDVVYRPIYNMPGNIYRFYGVRFTYGCDELTLSRILIPLLLQQQHRIFCLPIKIFDQESIYALFSNISFGKFSRILFEATNKEDMRDFIIRKYWQFMIPNAGLPQYIICLLTNIYFKIITRQSSIFKSEQIIAHIKDRVYPVPLLMGLGLFTFSNYRRYNWYSSGIVTKGRDLVNRFINTAAAPTLPEWVAGSDLSNDWEGDETKNYGI